MPTIKIDKQDLLNLIGKSIADEQLEETINLIKPEVEEISDKELTYEISPDRPDLFSVEGLARAVRSYLAIETGLIQYSVDKPILKAKVEAIPERPFVVVAVIREVKLTDEFVASLMNLQEVLHATLGRNRKKMAIGVHDFDKIKGPIVYKTVDPQTKIVPLQMPEEMSLAEILEKHPKGKEFAFVVKDMQNYPVIVDQEGIFSFPPIINGERTKVTPHTKNLLVEITGTDKATVEKALDILVCSLAERGTKIEGVLVNNEVTPKMEVKRMEISLNDVNKLIGLKLTEDEVSKILERMGYGVVDVKKGLIVGLIPAYRADIMHPVDVIEDVAIGYGLNNLEPELPSLGTVGKPHPLEKLGDKIRHIMIGFGYQELLLPVLTNPNDIFVKMDIKPKPVIEIENPISDQYMMMRPWLTPGLMRVLSANKHTEYPQRIFEIGDVVLPADNEVMSDSIKKLAIASCHSKASFTEIKSIVESLLANLGIQNYSVVAHASPHYIVGRAAEVVVGGKPICNFGEIHPKVLEKFALEMPVAVAELNVEKLL